MRRTLGSLVGLGLAIILSQFPEYAQQYTQRLGGAVDELKIVTEEFDRAATTGGLTRVQALERYNASNDDFLAGRGASMTATFQRYEQLSSTLAQIEGAGAYERLRSLPVYFDTDIGQRTLENYKPAVPVTLEGLAYAGVGFAIGYLVLSAFWRICTLTFRRRRHVYKY